MLTGTDKSGKKPKVKREVSKLGDPAELASHIKDYPEWNDYQINANGYTFKQFINGTLMSEVQDLDKENRRDKGLIGLQLHGGKPMKVQFRKIRIKHIGK